MASVIRVGVAGWDYPDWAGIVYPSPANRGFDRLSYLAGVFDALEINVTFYRAITAKTSRSWNARVPSDGSFLFTAKLYQLFTHASTSSLAHRSGPGGADREPSPSGTGDIDLRSEARVFLDAMEPLRLAGRLGAVLMQFPHAFHHRPEARRHLARLVELLPGLPLVAEFRHRSWDDERALDLLRELGVGFCNIDQPALGSTLPPTEHVTSSRVGYIRLHGRNAASWFARGEARTAGRTGGGARYDYFYTMEELLPWSERGRRMAGRAEEVFIIANNHYRGKAPANALMLKSALGGRRVGAPAGLIEAYPDLAKAADPVKPAVGRAPRQRRLF